MDHYHVTDIFVPIAYKDFYFYWEGGKYIYILSDRQCTVSLLPSQTFEFLLSLREDKLFP